MRPERKKANRPQTGIARARMLIKAHLAWLEGSPIRWGQEQVEWQPLPGVGQREPQSLVVDREKLRKSEYTFRQLLGDFPRALPKVVGETAHWSRRVGFLLDRLKGAIHEQQSLTIPLDAPGELLPDKVVRMHSRIGQECSEAVPLAEALVWAQFFQPESALQRLRWVTDHLPHIQVLYRALPSDQANALIFLLSDLARLDGAPLLEPILRLLADPRCFTLPLGGLEDFAHRWTKAVGDYQFLNDPQKLTPQNFPQREHLLLGPRLVRFLFVMAQQPARQRKRGWQMIPLIFPVAMWDRYEVAWKEMEHRFDGALQLVRERKSFYRVSPRGCCPFRADMEAYLPDVNGTFFADSRFLTLADLLGKAVQLEEFELLKQFLSTFPERRQDWFVRGPILTCLLKDHDWRQRPQYYGRRYLGELLRAWKNFARILSGQPEMCVPWDFVIEGWHLRDYHAHWRSTPADVPQELPQRELWPEFTEAVRLLVQANVFHPDDLGATYHLIRITRNAAETCRLLKGVKASGSKISEDGASFSALRWAYVIDPSDQNFPSLQQALWPVMLEDIDAGESLHALHLKLQAAGWGNVLSHLLRKNEAKAVCRLANTIETLEQFQTDSALPRNDFRELPSWGKRYPDAFHETLSRLAGLTSQAETLAESVLGKCYPDPQKLQRELDVLREKLQIQPDRADLTQRAENLARRIRSPIPVTPRREVALREKLQSALARTVVTRWQEMADAILTSTLHQMLGVDEFPEWLWDRTGQTLLTGLFRLSESDRKWGIKLLRFVCGNADWHPLQEGANQAFLSRMRARGLRLEPWCQPKSPWELQLRNGHTVHVSLEQHSRDVLLMGYWFCTCLSPNSFNFFSAVANALDINKLVLFAKTPQGKVLGRCLLAIGKSGALVTYHPYEQEQNLNMGAIVAETVEALAREMGTVVTTDDEIEALVMGKWYNDGSRDPGVAIDSTGSPLAKLLSEPPGPDFFNRLNSLLAPDGLTAVSLPFVLGMTDLRQDVKPLFDSLRPMILESLETLPVDSRLRVALMAEQAGDEELARREILTQAPRYFKKDFYGRYGQVNSHCVWELWIKYQPTIALRHFRATRPAHVDDDDQERYERRELLIAIYEQLGRTEKANRLRNAKT